MQRIIKHIQLLVIIGLLTGIAGEWIRAAAVISWPEPKVTVYAKEPVACDYRCQTVRHIENRARELYKENESWDLERYRQEAIIENRDMLIGLLDESSFIDYKALENKYGY